MTIESTEHTVGMNGRRMTLDPKPKLARSEKILSMSNVLNQAKTGYAVFLASNTPRTMAADQISGYNAVLIVKEVVSEHRWMYVQPDKSLTPISDRHQPVFLVKCLRLRYDPTWGQPIIEKEVVEAPKFTPRAGTSSSRKSSYRRRVQKKWDKRYGGEHLVHSAEEVHVIMGTMYVSEISKILTDGNAASVRRQGNRFPPHVYPKFEALNAKRLLSPIE